MENRSQFCEKLSDDLINDNFRDIIIQFNFSDKKEHLKKEEFSAILVALNNAKLSYFHGKSIKFEKHMKGYINTVAAFKEVRVWNEADANEKIIKDKYSTNIIYYYIMVIIRRLEVRFEDFEACSTLVNCIRKEELAQIDKILNDNFNVSVKAAASEIKPAFNKMILYFGKYLNEISEYEYLQFFNNFKVNDAYAKTEYKLLQHLGLIDKDLIYGYVIKKSDIDHIKRAMKELGYVQENYDKVITVLNKIINKTGKYIYDVNEEDIYDLIRSSTIKIIYAKATFYVLKYLRVLNDNAVYNNPITAKEITPFHIINQSEKVISSYNDYVKYISHTMYKKTAARHEYEARTFLDWLFQEYREEIDTLEKLTFDIITEYALWKKCRVIPKTNNVYSKATINSDLSRLKRFILYLYENKKLSDNWAFYLTGANAKFNNLYYDKTKKIPEPIPIEERRKIEEIIYGIDDNKYYKEKRMLKLLYLYGMRPSEVVILKLNCIVGTFELPQLHIHRAKGFKERYIPLTQEGLAIIKEMQELNNNSPAVYNEFDNETCQRLFHEKGCLTSPIALGRIFGRLLVENELKSPDGEAKHTQYVLRQIRITTWLEAGISEYEVAVLVGHEEVDSHNSYLVGKEKRTQNAKLVYDTYYADLIKEIDETGTYTEKEDMAKENNEYIVRLKDSLVRIESKTINIMVLEEAYKDFPEYAIPLPCGNCLGKVLYTHDFECEGMQLPCLECEELSVDAKHIQIFDEFIGKVYLNLDKREKAMLVGLVERSNNLLQRLKKFYVDKFRFDPCKIDGHFSIIRSISVPKRGRKKSKIN
jgi:integrase